MIWFLVAAAVAVADLLIKRWVDQKKEEKSSESFLNGKVILTKYYNDGAILGVLKDKVKILSGLTLVMVGIIIGFLLSITGKKGNVLLKTGLSLILGGAASNTYERLTKGHVTDYIRINIGPKKLSKVVFNMGDFCILVGCIFSIIGGFLRDRK